jgi:protein tyrosine/serine phosphatase
VPTVARKLNIPGIKDAGKVDEFLYRGGQPSERGLEELKKLGVNTIIDLRGEWPWEVSTERRRAQSLGMHFVNMPGNGWSAPSDQQVAEFFEMVRERPRKRIFVHCWLGGDRSGVFIAVYRIAFEGWTPEAAIREMREYHFQGFWHPNMKAYIRNFPERLARSPSLAPFRHRAPRTGKKV